MTEALKDLGLQVGHRRVGRLMRQNRISVIRTRKHKVTIDSNHKSNIAPNLLDHDVTADRPNQKYAVISAILVRVKGSSTWLQGLICIQGAWLAGLSVIG